MRPCATTANQWQDFVSGGYTSDDYCFVYEVRDGKVRRIREYMDTRGGRMQVFGVGGPVQLIEFTALTES